MRILPLSLFDYDPATKRLSADASDLGPGAMWQVYADAIDLGVQIHSHHTGKEATFAVDHIEVDGEEDILYWDLTPTPLSMRLHPRVVGMTVRIYND